LCQLARATNRMTLFEIETSKPGGYAFVDKLVVSVEGVVFGRRGAPSEKGLVVGEIASLINNISKQQQFKEFLSFLSTKETQEVFKILNDACWGSGCWEYEQVGAPSDPFVFLALPAATELFDLERAYLIEFLGGCSRIVYEDVEDGCIKEVEVKTSEYANAWGAVIARLRAS
jgi:hypothetical protein